MRLVFVVIISLLAGCAELQPISDANRKKVSSVGIHPQVAKPPQMYYLGPSGAGFLFFGAIGGALGAGTIEESRKSFQSYVEKNGISIEKIAATEVEAAFRRAGKLPLTDKPGPDSAVLIVSIQQYGFSIPNGFSSLLVPILHLRCEVKDAGGNLLWTANDRLLTLGNPVEGLPPEKIQNDPVAMEGAWRAAARHLAASIAKSY
jgi:hypothetical protein